jgi:predicted restriction endonuclease
MSRSEYAKNNGLMQCVICEYKTHVDIAHIKAVKDFDLNTTLDVVNHISNLTALCPNHHWEFDHNIITL